MIERLTVNAAKWFIDEMIAGRSQLRLATFVATYAP
jgi:hypothetical protein